MQQQVCKCKLLIEALDVYCMCRLQLALCGGSGGDGGGICSANTLPALGVVTLATRTGGLVPSSTGTYTACADCNLHCGGCT